MNKQYLKENKSTIVLAILNTFTVLYVTLNLVEIVKELKGGK